MRWYRADLHIHSVLSPCGGLEMAPQALMKRAKDMKLDWIAITDHNSLANCPAYEIVAHKWGIAFTWGVEIQTSEEIHILAYFDDSSSAQQFDKLLYDSLLPVANDPDYFGDQVIIDENEGIINLVERALINSSIWDLDTTLEMVRNHNGYCIPAHIDAERNSIISQLGFIPDPGVFPALGITARLEIDEFLISHKELRGCSFLRCSDAHYLGDLGVGFTDLFVHEPSIRELDLAARKIDKRIIKI